MLFDVLNLVIEKLDLPSIPIGPVMKFSKTRYSGSQFRFKILLNTTVSPHFREYIVKVDPNDREQVVAGRVAIKGAFSIIHDGLLNSNIKANFCPYYSKRFELQKDNAHIVAMQFFTNLQTNHARLEIDGAYKLGFVLFDSANIEQFISRYKNENKITRNPTDRDSEVLRHAAKEAETKWKKEHQLTALSYGKGFGLNREQILTHSAAINNALAQQNPTKKLISKTKFERFIKSFTAESQMSSGSGQKSEINKTNSEKFTSQFMEFLLIKQHVIEDEIDDAK